ncbi:MAG: sulfatase [bacterium]|nr:sulfatase [bacterium]
MLQLLKVCPRALVLFLLPLALMTGCGNPSNNQSQNLDPTFLWNGNLHRIDTNSGSQFAWSGFTVKTNSFVANKNISKFILWRDKEGETELSIRYLLKPKPAEFFVNSKKIVKLRPRYKAEPFKIKVSFLKGFNFIEFRKKNKSLMKIKSITIGNSPANQIHHLEGNKTLTRFHSPGSGTLRLKGDGKLRVKKVQFLNGKKVVIEEEKGSGFLSSTIEYKFNFDTLGFIELSAVSGSLDVTGYTFKGEAPPAVKGEAPPAIEGEAPPAIKGKPNIFIFLIDGCHAGHLGHAGYHRDTSPNIDKFARDGVVFTDAYANATFTRSSVASIFTGFYPHRHKLRILTNRLPKGLFMLPEFMRKKGYRTSLLTEAGNISKFFGFSQGVDNYQKVFRKWNDPRYLDNNIDTFFNRSLDADGPFFTYVHFRAPHFPIIPPPPFLDMYKKEKKGIQADRLIFHIDALGKGGHKYTKEEIQDIVDDYDSTINYVDSQLGKMLETLKQKGLYESSFIVFTSDHGEALYEHRYLGHGHNVYDETSRVPLIVKFPAGMNIKGKVDRVAQLVDIFPTFARLFGEERYFDGRSLLDAINNKEDRDLFAFSTSFGTPPSIGVRWRNWYYIKHLYNNSDELFDLETDPLTNVAAIETNHDTLTFFQAKFLDWLHQFDNLERTSQSVDLKKLPKEEYENLKSLGYIN